MASGEIRVQLMDYQYKDGVNVADINDYGSKSSSWTILTATSATFAATSSPSHQYINNFIYPVTGVEYIVSATITNYGGSGYIGFSTSGGPPGSARKNSDGSISGTFIADGNGIDLFAQNTVTSATMSAISVRPVTEVDINKSIIGELDVSSHSDFPLALTFNIADYKDIEARKGSFSKTFIIPATGNNNSLLKNLYVPNSTFSGNPITEQKKCRIIIGRLYSIKGVLKISSVTTEKYPSSYSCVFYGDNTSWTTLLDNALLKDVPLDNSTALEIKKDSIMDSWSQLDATTTTSPIVYPLVSYGDFNPSVGSPGCVQLLRDDCPATAGAGDSGGAYVGSKTGASGPYYNMFNDQISPSVDWRVCIWVYDLFKAIFKSIGYTISSTFIESSLFKQLLYASPNMKYNNPGQRWLDYSFKSSGSCIVDSGNITTTGAVPGAFSNWTDKEINLDNCSNFLILNDDSGGWDSATGYWTVPEYGFYDLSAGGFYFNFTNVRGRNSSGTDSDPTTINPELYFLRKTVGQTHWGVVYDTDGNVGTLNDTKDLYDVNNGSLGPISYYWHPGSFTVNGVYLNKGDVIKLFWRVRNVYTGSSTPSATYPQFNYELGKSGGSEYSINFQPELAAYGQTYDLRDVIPDEHTQLDFIKGVAHAFNLQFQTNERKKEVTIEPFNDFYKDMGLSRDWTHKIDRSRETNDEWVKTDMKREMVFKYKSDSNDKAGKENVESWWNGIEDIYPYFETLSDAFDKGKSEFTNPFFSGTWSSKDKDVIFNPAVIPRISPSIGMLSTEPVSNAYFNQTTPPYRADKGYSFEPRLLYYNQYVKSTAIGGVYSNSMLIQEWGYPGGSFSSSNAIAEWGYDASGTLNTLIPQAASFSTQNINIPNLCYGSIWVDQYDPDTGTFSGAQEINKGLYQTYYRGMMEITKSNPRKRTCYVDLKINDIIGLDFRYLIHIDGSYWRLNKIIDYAPHLNIPTKVELIEWRDLGEFQTGTPTVQYTDGWLPYDPNNLGA